MEQSLDVRPYKTLRGRLVLVPTIDKIADLADHKQMKNAYIYIEQFMTYKATASQTNH